MTKSQLKSLSRFDDEWRTLADLKRRGVAEADVAPLIKQGLVETRVCGIEYYRTTWAGLWELRKLREEVD